MTVFAQKRDIAAQENLFQGEPATRYRDTQMPVDYVLRDANPPGDFVLRHVLMHAHHENLTASRGQRLNRRREQPGTRLYGDTDTKDEAA